MEGELATHAEYFVKQVLVNSRREVLKTWEVEDYVSAVGWASVLEEGYRRLHEEANGSPEEVDEALQKAMIALKVKGSVKILPESRQILVQCILGNPNFNERGLEALLQVEEIRGILKAQLAKRIQQRVILLQLRKMADVLDIGRPTQRLIAEASLVRKELELLLARGKLDSLAEKLANLGSLPDGLRSLLGVIVGSDDASDLDALVASEVAQIDDTALRDQIFSPATSSYLLTAASVKSPEIFDCYLSAMLTQLSTLYNSNTGPMASELDAKELDVFTRLAELERHAPQMARAFLYPSLHEMYLNLDKDKREGFQMRIQGNLTGWAPGPD